jgi:hypothetical protein
VGVFGKPQIQISVGRQAVPTDVFHGFSQSVQEEGEIIPQVRLRAFPSTCFPVYKLPVSIKSCFWNVVCAYVCRYMYVCRGGWMYTSLAPEWLNTFRSCWVFKNLSILRLCSVNMNILSERKNTGVPQNKMAFKDKKVLLLLLLLLLRFLLQFEY